MNESLENLESFETSKEPKVQLRLTVESTKDGYTHAMHDVYDLDGNKVGFLDMSFYPDEHRAVISTVEIDYHLRGKGYGKEIYKQAIAIAKQDGYKLSSAYQLLDDAVHVWDSLVREGLAEKVGDTYYAK